MRNHPCKAGMSKFLIRQCLSSTTCSFGGGIFFLVRNAPRRPYIRTYMLRCRSCACCPTCCIFPRLLQQNCACHACGLPGHSEWVTWFGVRCRCCAPSCCMAFMGPTRLKVRALWGGVLTLMWTGFVTCGPYKCMRTSPMRHHTRILPERVR